MEKLKGMEDYNNWKFVMKMILMHEDLYECIMVDGCKDEKKQQKALAKICLSVGSSALQHVRKATSAYEAWNNLQKAYEDKGLCRRLGLLRSLFGVKLKDMDGMQGYISRITELAQQLSDISSPLDDEFIAVVFLGGLTNDYDPLIMALENSNLKLTSETVKAKLLQEQQRRDEKLETFSDLNALATKKTFKGFKCFRCKKIGHMKKDCPRKSDNYNETSKHKEKSLLTALSVNLKNNVWYVDSGATNHMCNCQENMVNFQNFSKPLEVNVANGEKVSTCGQGSVLVNLKGGIKTISNVYYVPKLSANLLSVSELNRKGYSVTFNDKQCTIFDGSVVIATASCLNGVYQLDIVGNMVQYQVGSEIAMNSGLEGCDNVPLYEELGSNAGSSNGKVKALLSSTELTQMVWHRRLGHLNHRSMNLMKNGIVSGMKFQNTTFDPCTVCLQGKQTKLPFPKKSMTRSNEILGLVHTDVCGPIQEASINGSLYFITFIDDYSRKTFIYFMKTKSEAFHKFKIFKAYAENQTSRKIKVLRSDNGGEYVNNVFQDYLKKCGIKHETTVPHCSQQNGVAERANRTIMDKVRCMLQESGLGKQYWAEAANTAVYLKNLSPTKAVKGSTPEEAWTSKKVNIGHLRVFGCLAYAIVENCKKLDSRNKKFIFVGYCEGTKGYRLIDPEYPKKCVKAKHVAFLENKFINRNVSNDDKSIDSDVVWLYNSNDTTLSTSDEPEGQSLDSTESSLSDIQSDDTNIRRQTMFRLNDTEDSQDMHEMLDGTYIPRPSSIDSEDSNVISFEDANESGLFAGLVGTILDRDVPTNINEALSGDEAQQWKEAIDDEYNSFIKNKCWTLVDLPKGHKPVQCKWVFNRKRGLNNELLKYKARLVAKGFTQRYGIDYNETFSPVVRYSTIRILLALAAQYEMQIEHLDVKTAFLNGDLTETVYMVQPEGFVDKANEKKVYKLHKAIYGLKQAAKAWYERINYFLTVKLNFKRLSSEPCVYTYNQDQDMIIIALYVDDILLFTLKDSQNKNIIKKQLMSEFSMNDLGPSNQILGMRIVKSKDGKFTLDQSNYIQKVLYKFNMLDCKPAKTPMEVGIKLQKEENNSCNYEYRSLIGYLMYLAVCSRPDIAHSVSYLSQFNNCYSEMHWKAAKRVLRYLKGTIDYCLSFEKGNMVIIGFTDADWGADQLDRRSYTGYVFNLGNSIVSWESRKQRTVALSSTEAEYMAISDSCKEAVFLQNFVRECTSVNCNITLFNDNQSAQKLCNNIVSHSRTKHIDIRHHFIRELVNKNVVNLNYVSTEEMLADIFTKSLTKDKHVKLVSILFKMQV